MVAGLFALLWACDATTSTDDSATTPSDTSTTPDDTSTDTETLTDDTGPDPDADGDGFPASEDCDDTSIFTYPGAEEWCDPVDHDCDGEDLEEGVCGKAQLLEAVATGWYAPDEPGPVGDAEGPYFLGDLDGEPGEELGIFTWYPVGGGTYFGALALVSEPLANPGSPILEVADQVLVVDFEAGPPNWYIPAGDFNGDGQDDLWVITEGNEAVTGRAHLLLGPSTGWPDVGYLSEVATTIWEPTEHAGRNEDFGTSAGSEGDYNADGLTDLIVRATNEYDAYLVQGRDSVLEGWTTISDEVGLYHAPTSDGAGFSGDQDGDGHDDVVFLQSYVYWQSGIELPVAGDMDLIDSRTWLTTEDDPYCDEDHVGDRVLRLGDWSGDGIEDLAAGCAEDLGTPEPEYTLHIIDGAGIAAAESGTSLFSLSLGSWVTSQKDLDAPWQQRVVPDMDDDGLADLLLNPVEFLDTLRPRFESHLIRSGDGMPGPYTEMDPGYSFVSDLDPEGTYLYPWDGGDFDGDGRTDLSFSVGDNWHADGASGTGAERGSCVDVSCTSSRIVMGWDVPWDDAFYW